MDIAAIGSAPALADGSHGVRPPLTVAYGGGGLFGIAYAFGVADALLSAGVELRSVPAVGTSAGSWVASALAVGIPFARLCELPPIRVPEPRPGRLRAMARDVFGDARSPLVRISVATLPRLRRELVPGDAESLADLVAASSSVPGVFLPSPVGSRLCVDGGVRSMVSADLAPAARRLLVVAPLGGSVLGGPALGLTGRWLQRQLRGECRIWSNRHQASAEVVVPNDEIARLVRTPLDLFDLGLAQSVYPLAYRQGLRLMHSGGLQVAVASERSAA